MHIFLCYKKKRKNKEYMVNLFINKINIYDKMIELENVNKYTNGKIVQNCKNLIKDDMLKN